jgi:hypothetical protein
LEEDNPGFAATFLVVFLLFKRTANLLELFLGTSVSSLAQPDLSPTFLAPTALFRKLFDPDRDAPPKLENLKISSCLWQWLPSPFPESLQPLEAGGEPNINVEATGTWVLESSNGFWV